MHALPTSLALVALLAAGSAHAAWEVRSSPTTQPLRAVHMRSAQSVWASGGSSGPVVVKSDDHLATATLVTNLPAALTLPLNTIWSSGDGSVVEAFGNGQATLRSSDGGSSWTTLKPANPFVGSIHFHAASYPTGTTAYLAGVNNTGLTWFRGRMTALGAAMDDTNDPAFLDFVFNAAIYPERFVALQYLTADSGYLATEYSLMQQTGPNGWRKLFGPVTPTLKALSFADAEHGVVVGTDGFTRVVTPAAPDGVAPTQPPEPGRTLNGVHLAPDSSYGVVVGNGGYIAETYDGGLTWKSKPSPTTSDLLAVHCFDRNTCAAVGADGTLLSYVNTAPTPVGVLSDTEGGEGELIIATIAVQDAEGDPISVDPTAGFPPEVTDGTWTLVGNQLEAKFTMPSVICGDRTITLAPVLSDGRMSQAAALSFTFKDQQPDPPVDLQLTLSPPQLPWSAGEHHTATATATSRCGRTLDYSFSKTGNLPAPDVDGGVATFDFRGPICTPISGTLTVVASDAGATATASAPITVEPTRFPPSLTIGFSDGLADGATLSEGASTTVTIGASHACSSGFTYDWTCTGLPLAPSGDSVTITNPGVCDPVEVRCTVEVATNGHPAATASFSLQLEPSNAPPAVATSYSAGQLLQHGQSTVARLMPSHACTNFDFASSCAAGARGATWDVAFDHDRAQLCQKDAERCEVTVTPVGAGGVPRGQPVVVALEVELEPTKFAPTISATLGNGTRAQTILAGEFATATASVTHACNASPSLSWSCDDGTTRAGSSLTLVHPAKPSCGPVARTCTVTADAGDGHPTASESVTVTFDWPIDPLAIGVIGASEWQTLGDGDSLILTATGEHPCAATDTDYDFDWSCTGDTTTIPIDARRLLVRHPGPTAATCRQTVPVVCTVTAALPTPAGEMRAEASQILAMGQVADNPHRAQIAVEGGSRPLTAGERIRLSLEGSECAGLLTHGWRATLLETETVLVEEEETNLALVVPPICGGDTLRVEVSYGGFGDPKVLDLQVARDGAPPEVHPPEPADFDPGPVVTLACDAREVAILRPRIDAACTVQPQWRQLTSLPLQTTELPGGALEIALAAEDGFSAVVGRTASFELIAADRTQASEPRRFDLEIRAPEMLELHHSAGQAQAAGGELIPMLLEIENGCGVGLDGIDVRVVLEGLAFIPGSARLDGEAIPDPEPIEPSQVFGEAVSREGLQVVRFSNLPVPAGSLQQLTYQVRRNGLGVGPASAHADAVLTANPANRLTPPIDLSTEAPWAAGVPAVGCSCGSSGAASWLPVAFAALVVLRRRRTRE